MEIHPLQCRFDILLLAIQFTKDSPNRSGPYALTEELTVHRFLKEVGAVLPCCCNGNVPQAAEQTAVESEVMLGHSQPMAASKLHRI